MYRLSVWATLMRVTAIGLVALLVGDLAAQTTLVQPAVPPLIELGPTAVPSDDRNSADGRSPEPSDMAFPRTPWETRLPRGSQPTRALPDPSPRTLANARRYVASEINPELSLPLVLGRPKILQLAEVPTRIFLADESIARSEILDRQSGRQLALTGKQVGTTVLTLWFASEAAAGEEEVLCYLVSVSEDPDRSRRLEQLLSDLEEEINRAFPNSVVQLSYVGAEVLVRGKAKDIDEASQILRIVSRSLPTAAAEERLSVLEDPWAAAVSAGEQGEAEGGVDRLFQPLAPGAPFFTDPDRIEQAGGIGGIRRGRSMTGVNAAQINTRVVNMLEVAGVHQVQIQVTLAEVVRDAGRSLLSEVKIGDSFARPGSTSVDFTSGLTGGQFKLQSNRFFLQIDALKRLGLARSLAEPNLTSLNGQPANFLVGGQFPILESTSTVAVVNQTIRYVPFGIQLSVIPTVSDGDRIRLNLQATVSETTIGAAGGGGIGGVNPVEDNDPALPPSLTTRSFQSTVELRSTESIAVAGLIRTSLVNNSVRTPFLGDVPVVGNLFSNKRSTYQEQELILVVTPQLVSPVPIAHRAPLPGSDSFEPDDWRFFIKGDLQGAIAEDYRTPVRDSLARMRAFRSIEQRYILGMPGHASGRPLPPPPARLEVLP